MALWVRFEHATGSGFGLLAGDSIQVHTGDMFGTAQATGTSLALAEARLLNPVQPGKFIALWNNFRELAVKLGQAIPEEPLYFIKTPNAYLAPGGVIRKPSGYAGKVAYEGELGIVIGKVCSNASEQAAANAIFGYTCVNDVTALDILNENPTFAQWTRAKSADTFAPFGPAVATGLDWSQLRIRTLLNGRERQNYPANDMILPPEKIVSLISREMSLLHGDVIACGTSVGVLPMRQGMRVEVVIDGIGTLGNTFE